MRIAAWFLCAAAALGATSAGASPHPTRRNPIKIAVFRFELEDLTPAAAYAGSAAKGDSTPKVLQEATRAARKELAGSGRYRIVSVKGVEAAPVRNHTLLNCDGCEAAIARKLGAQQSMLGIVRRATQTDYYILLVIRDTKTGKIIDSQGANFAGDEAGWPDGARLIIRYQVLPR